jgi:hypothetical protein
MHAACVISPPYLPHARVLAASFRAHHPDARLTVLLVDEPQEAPPVEIAGAEVLTTADVGIDVHELHRRAVLFDAQGLISSLRPVLLSHILARNAEAVLLLDADMLVLGSFDDIWWLARDAGVLLSPHTRVPLPGKPGAWREEELLRSGTFNGGFLGVGREGVPFLDWMMQRAARDCLRAPERGLLYTQTWLNLVPALFQHQIVEDAGINAQMHGIGKQDVNWDATPPRLGPAQLRLYHFAGFDPAQPDRLCRHYDTDDMSLDDRPGLRRLCAEYVARLRDAGWPARHTYPWSTTAGGFLVDGPLRRVYREAILDADRDHRPYPPDPFDAEQVDAVLSWLQTPPPGTSVSRYLLALRAERPDLLAVFADVPGTDEDAYLAWAAEKGRASTAAETEVLPPLNIVRRDRVLER